MKVAGRGMRRWMAAAVLAAAGCVHYAPKPPEPERTAAALAARGLNDPEPRAYLAAHGGPAADAVVASWDFETLARVAAFYNPELAVARAHERAAEAVRLTAAERPNPTVNLAAGYNQDAATGVSPWFPGIDFDLPIETAGKRGAREAQAAAGEARARAELIGAAWDVRTQLREAWLGLTAAREKRDLLDEQAACEERRVGLLRARLKAGSISRPELTAAELSWRRRAYEAGDAARAESAARGRLAAALGVPAEALEGVVFRTDADDAGTEPPPRAEARNAALRGRPDVVMALADYAVAEADLRLEVAGQYPDVHLGPGLQWDQGERKWTIGVGFELPIFNRHRGAIAEAAARREEAGAKIFAAQAAALNRLDAAYRDYELAQEQERRARGVVAEAESGSRAADSARGEGEADALQVDDARLEWIAARVMLADALAARSEARAAIDDAIRNPAVVAGQLETSTNPKR